MMMLSALPRRERRHRDDGDKECGAQSFHLYDKPSTLTQRKWERIVRHATQRLKGVLEDGGGGSVEEMHDDSSNTSDDSENVAILTHSQIELGEQLGRGAFSCVYEVKSISEDKKHVSTQEDNPVEEEYNVVVKFLRTKLYNDLGLFAASAADLVKEGNILATLSHKNVIKLHAVSSASGVDSYLLNKCYHDSYFLVLERLSNTLADRIDTSWKIRHTELYKYEEDNGSQPVKEVATDVPTTAVSNSFKKNKAWKNRLTEKLTKLRRSSPELIPQPKKWHSSSNPTTATGPASSSCSLSSSFSGICGCDDIDEITLPEDSIAARAKSELLEERIDVAMQLADAIKYLHEQNVIHRDLKPDNIGFDATSDTLKVFDFDTARRVPEAQGRNHNKDHGTLYRMTQTVGSPRYMAPECFRSEPYNLKADVYSYGLLFHQIITLERPYDDLILGDDRRRMVFSEGVRPHVCDLGLPQAVERMLNNSLSPCIKDRPTMQVVCNTLAEQKSDVVRLGSVAKSSTSSASLTTQATVASTAYVTSCAFQSFSDNNPAFKKKMKAMRRVNKDNSWNNITLFKNWKNSKTGVGKNKDRFLPFHHPLSLAKA